MNNYLIESIDEYCDFHTQIILEKTCKSISKLTKIKKIPFNLHKFFCDDILKIYPFLEQLFLTNNSTVTNDRVIWLQNLKYINLRDVDYITDTTLCKFVKLRGCGLEFNCTITDNSIKYLLQLKYLNIGCNFTITDDGIKNLTKLQKLKLDDNYIITNDGIKNLTSLKFLDLTRTTNITDDGLKFLSNLETLILFNNTKITCKGLKYLPKLTNLDISWNNMISVDDINSLQKLKNLWNERRFGLMYYANIRKDINIYITSYWSKKK